MTNKNPRMNTQQFHAAKDLRRAIRIIEDYGVEVVSYGLAPNPFGFCYDSEHDMPESIEREFSLLLNALTTDEENELKSLYL